MTVRNSLNNGFNMVRLSWIWEIIYLITFGLIMSVILLPFAFLVAIASVGIGDDVTNPFEFGLFFWASVLVLSYVSILFIVMMVGMIQKIGEDKSRGVLLEMEDLIKYPFQYGRFQAFAFLALITLAIYGGLNLLLLGGQQLFSIYSNDAVWDDWLWTILQIVVFLVITPPFIMACHRIIKDQSRNDAFISALKRYNTNFQNTSVLNLLSVVPIAIVIGLISFLGTVISWVGDGNTAQELFYILALAFGIIVVSLFMVFIAMPYYLITIGNSEEETTNPI